MSWIDHHRNSEVLASEAEIALLRGESSEAEALYRKAAREEQVALDELDHSKSRTLGVTVVSAASLYYKAGELAAAEVLAHRWLGEASFPEFAVDQLRGLLQSIWSEQIRKRSGIHFAPGEVIVGVSGGEIIEGGAPLDLILEKVQTVQSLFYRTAEWLRGYPHRKRGRPSQEIQDSFRPWLFQTVPGSYQFAVAIQEPRQPSLFETDEPGPADIASEFLRIVEASVESPEEELPKVLPDMSYRSTILKLTRNLAPTGRRYSRLELRSAGGRRVTLLPANRAVVNEAIRTHEPRQPTAGTKEDVRGVLRALHLDQDWIEVTVGQRHLKIDQVGEAVDDLIGPMVNHSVIVRVNKDARGLHFLDIEVDE